MLSRTSPSFRNMQRVLVATASSSSRARRPLPHLLQLPRAVTPRNTVRFLFPSLGDVNDPSRPRRDSVSEFAVHFPHETHLDVVGRNTLFPEPRFVAVSWKSRSRRSRRKLRGLSSKLSTARSIERRVCDEAAEKLRRCVLVERRRPSIRSPTATPDALLAITPIPELRLSLPDCQTCHKLPPRLYKLT